MKNSTLLRVVLGTLIVLVLVGIFFYSTASRQPGLHWTFQYDDAGRTTRIVDPGGKTTSIRYVLDPIDQDRVQRVEQHISDGSRVTYEFDSFGRRAAMTDATGTTRYKYDGFSRLTEVHREVGSSLLYAYDSLNRLRSIRLAGEVIVYKYDFLGRLAAMQTPVGDVTYGYDEARGTFTRTLPNGIRTTWAYHPDGRLSSITHADGDDMLIAQYAYESRPDGMISRINEWLPGGERLLVYEYDTAQRLISVSDSEAKVLRYRFDRSGNRTEHTSGRGQAVESTFDWAGRMTTYNGAPSSHDASGNLTSYVSSDGERVFAFDGANRLQDVNAGAVTYFYDGDGGLIARSADNSRTTFILDPLSDVWQPLLATDEQNRRTFYVWEDDIPLATISDGKIQFFLHDHLGSVRQVVDESGNLIEQLDFDPFGAPRHTSRHDGLYPGFAGLFFDPAPSIYLTRARAFDPDLGLFLQIDPEHRLPLGSSKDDGLYTYAGHDPVNFSDRTGLSPHPYSERTPWQSPGVLGGLLFHQVLQDRPVSARQPSASQRPDLDTYRAEIRAYEQLRREMLQRHYMSAFTDYEVDMFGTAKDQVREKIQDWAYDAWRQTTIDLYVDFGRLNQRALDVIRPSNVPRNHEVMRRSLDGARTLNRVATRFQSTMGTLGTISTGAMTVADRVDYFGRAMMTLSPPIYLFDRRSWGWEGSGTIAIQGGTWTFDQELITQASPPWSRGEIIRFHNDRIETQYGTVLRQVTNNTRATSPVERFMMYRFPLGSYFDPHASSIESITTSRQRYQVSTRGGITETTGTWEATSHITADAPGGPATGAMAGIRAGLGGPGPSLVPSNVGGVYLRGAAGALDGLGTLRGVAVDEASGQLVLLSEDEGAIDLPPLRLDDVVTVFRTVYESGDAPSVTIDPDPSDPNGPIMLVGHGPGTDSTYVGWILFEADRLMKAYNLGRDNVTGRPVQSRIPGYQEILEAGFDGIAGAGPRWERFWIVPARVERRRSSGGQLTLLDVPLKVNSQRMILRNGKLEPAPNNRPSPGARAFSDWFTENYDLIAEETRSLPPAGSGMGEPVNVLAELRRIALTTAIAETMRDQGAPLPEWMRAYPVRPFPTPATTPALTVEQTKGDVVRTLYGGVRLSVPDAAVRTVAAAPEADALAPALSRAVATRPPWTPMSFTTDETHYKAVALPGANTRALGPGRLQEVDLVVPVQRGTALTLVRHFNSFFQPNNYIGAAWTLDLPRLEVQRIPVRRTEDHAEYKVVYLLTSPLGSHATRFSNWKYIPELNAELLVPDADDNLLGLAHVENEHIGHRSHALFFSDGRRWHFDEAGNLAAVEEAPLMTIYRRDGTGRIQRIEGWYGKYLRADIRLTYDGHGRLASATGSDGVSVTYAYDLNGLLTGVEASDGHVEYRYDHGLVTEILFNGQRVRHFTYADHGLLLREEQADGSVLRYNLAADTNGYTIGVSTSGTHEATASVRYDATFRPVLQVAEDGARIEWEYGKDAEVTARMTLPHGEQYAVYDTPDGRHRTLQGPSGGTYRATFDGGGRVLELRQEDDIVLQKQWHNDGRLASTIYETYAVHPQYREDGVASGTLITPPNAGPTYSEWMEIDYDEFGHVRAVRDNTGGEIQVGYEPSGAVAVVASSRGSIQFKRDATGRVTSAQTSWGLRHDNEFNADRRLARVEISYGPEQAVMKFDGERLQQARLFDGSTFDFAYFSRGERKGLIREIGTPHTRLAYKYDDQGWVTNVRIADRHRIAYRRDKQGRLVELRQSPLSGR